MAIVAPISSWETRRPLVLAVLCVLVAAWFAYDGWYGWPAADNAVYKKMQQPGLLGVGEQARKIALTWPGWHQATTRQLMGSRDFIKPDKPVSREDKAISRALDGGNDFVGFDKLAYENHFPEYHSITDIYNQRWIVLGVGIVALLGLFWYSRVRNLQIQADETGLTLANGQVIPWQKIKVIDNVRWHSKGYVRITYTGPDNQDQNKVLDGTLYENLPAVLELMAERANQAQMITPQPPTPPEGHS